MKTKNIFKRIIIILSIIVMLAGIGYSGYDVWDASVHPDGFGFSNFGFLAPFVIIPASLLIVLGLWAIYYFVIFICYVLSMPNKRKKYAILSSILMVILIIVISINHEMKINNNHEKILYSYDTKVQGICTSNCQKVFSSSNYKKNGIYKDNKYNNIIFIKDADYKDLSDEDMEYSYIYYYNLGYTVSKNVDKYFKNEKYLYDDNTNNTRNLYIALPVYSKNELINNYSEKLYLFYQDASKEGDEVNFHIYYNENYLIINNSENLLLLLKNVNYKKYISENEDVSNVCDVDYEYLNKKIGDSGYYDCYYANPRRVLDKYYDSKNISKKILTDTNNFMNIKLKDNVSQQEFINMLIK